MTKKEGSNPTPPPPTPPPTCEEKYPAPAGYSVEDTDFGTLIKSIQKPNQKPNQDFDPES